MNEDYDVKIEQLGWTTVLIATQNGDKWSTIQIREPEHEIPKIIKVLEDHLKGRN